MTNAERIAQYAIAARECGQAVKSIVIEKGKVAVTFLPPPCNRPIQAEKVVTQKARPN